MHSSQVCNIELARTRQRRPLRGSPTVNFLCPVPTAMNHYPLLRNTSRTPPPVFLYQRAAAIARARSTRRGARFTHVRTNGPRRITSADANARRPLAPLPSALARQFRSTFGSEYPRGVLSAVLLRASSSGARLTLIRLRARISEHMIPRRTACRTSACSISRYSFRWLMLDRVLDMALRDTQR